MCMSKYSTFNKKLVSGSMVNGLELVAQPRPDPVCVPCLAGKMNANPFPSSVNRSSLPLERIHSDLHELKTLTISGFRYWVTFIDDATGHHAVTFLCHCLHLLSETSVLPEMYLRLRELSLSLGGIHPGTDSLLVTTGSRNLVLMLRQRNILTLHGVC